MTEKLYKCPECGCSDTYSVGGEIYMCPDCGHEWNTSDTIDHGTEQTVVDAYGNVLVDGDTVTVIKDLPVKGSKPVKMGTKVKNIRLTDGDHNIDCKIDGFGPMSLKSEFVKKL